VFIGYTVLNGYETIKRLKEELTAEGYDMDEYNRVGELKAIRNAVDAGTVDSIFDKVWSVLDSRV
jgi:predicted transcriptional regulator